MADIFLALSARCRKHFSGQINLLSEDATERALCPQSSAVVSFGRLATCSARLQPPSPPEAARMRKLLRVRERIALGRRSQTAQTVTFVYVRILGPNNIIFVPPVEQSTQM